MNRFFPLIGLIAVTGCAVPVGVNVPVPAPPPSPAPEIVPPPVSVNPQSAKERFVRAVEANGCTFSSGNADLVLAQATLSQGDMGGIITELRAEGRGDILPSGEGFRLNTGACA